MEGYIKDTSGKPLAGVTLDIWEDAPNGLYENHDPGQPDYNLRGRFETDDNGHYSFRAIRPVPYPGRTPHIHMAVSLPGQPRFVTQCYIRGEPLNQRDMLLNAIRDPALRELLIVPFVPVPGASPPEQLARFDLVLGLTPVS